jgi:hypothetical protein
MSGIVKSNVVDLHVLEQVPPPVGQYAGVVGHPGGITGDVVGVAVAGPELQLLLRLRLPRGLEDRHHFVGQRQGAPGCLRIRGAGGEVDVAPAQPSELAPAQPIPPGGNYISFDDPKIELSPPVNVRSGIRAGETNEEIWGSVHLSVKRENDGWQIPTSQAYLDRYPNPNNPSTSDWAIFTIRIKSL